MASYLVAGAGTTVVNGTYDELGTNDGKPYYKMASDLEYLFWSTAQNQWYISTGLGFTGGPSQYRNTDTGATPPSTGWLVAGTGNPATGMTVTLVGGGGGGGSAGGNMLEVF